MNIIALSKNKLKKLIMERYNFLELRSKKWISEDPFRNDPPESCYESPYPYTIGIIKELWHLHWPYIAACKELQVKYKVLDISGPNWLESVANSGCDAFLVRPSVQVSTWKNMYEERLTVIANDLGKNIFPSIREIWLWESKRRMHYWLSAHRLPHPRTWVFYNFHEAMDFAGQTDLPIVFKTDLGSGASGVRILRKRAQLRGLVTRCFKRGVTSYRRAPLDKEWGFIFLQEFLPDAREWRIIRIGNSFFGYEKLKKGDFHSGSHRWSYGFPPLKLLNFVKHITDTYSMLSMAFDIFLFDDGRFLVNEMQTIFGMRHTYEMCVIDDNPGRLVYDDLTSRWRFEAGSFCQNYLCNLRVQTLIDILERCSKASIKD